MRDLTAIQLSNGLPQRAAFDQATTNVYVVDYSNNNVHIVSGSTKLQVATVDVGTGPINVLYANSNKESYVTDFGSNQIWIAYDSSNGFIYVPNGDGTMTVLD